MMRPESMRLQFGRRARLVLGAGIIAGFFQTETMEREYDSVAGHVLRPERQSPCRAVAHPSESSKVAIEQCRGLMRHEIEREPHQVPIQQRNRRAACARQSLLQRGEVAKLPIV